MFRKGDKIRVRDDFDWTSNPLYTIHMKDFQGKYGVVTSTTGDERRIYVSIDHEDDENNWVFLPRDLEKIDYIEGELLTVHYSDWENDCDNLYFDQMWNLNEADVEFLSYTEYDGERAALCRGPSVNGKGKDHWTFYLRDLVPVLEENFDSSTSLDSILGALL